VFLIGAVLARSQGAWAGFERLRWPAVGLSLLLWLGVATYFWQFGRTQLPPPEALRQLQRVAFAALQWSAIVAALGFAHRHWNRDHRWRARVTEAVFPVYLLHQTVIILLAWGLRRFDLAPEVEAAVLITGTLLACVAGYAAATRLGPLRPWLGLAPLRRGARSRVPVAAT
jgi:glucans biosynthesis protein C